MDWYRLAHKWGKPVRWLKKNMYSKEWLRHRAYMEMEPNMFNPMWYYFAQLTAEIAKGHAKKGDSKSINPLKRLITFITKKRYAPTKHIDPSTVKIEGRRELSPEVMARTLASKRAWFLACGLRLDGTMGDRKLKRRRLPRR